MWKIYRPEENSLKTANRIEYLKNVTTKGIKCKIYHTIKIQGFPRNVYVIDPIYTIYWPAKITNDGSK